MSHEIKKKLPTLLEEGAIIVDVRSPAEFAGGHAKGSINIPLNLLSEKAPTMLDRSKTILLCCASGTRSGMAVSVLKGLGFNQVMNAGPWGNLI